MTWTKATDALGTRDPTPEEDEAIEEVRAVAVEFAAGRLPLPEAKRLTSAWFRTSPDHDGIPIRWLAARFTPPAHETFRPLMTFLDALIAAQGAIATKHGIVDRALLVETGGTLNRGTGEIRFPVAYENARGVFRTKQQQGPTLQPFTTVPNPTDEREFWEKD
jgi:hypothetical protein